MNAPASFPGIVKVKKAKKVKKVKKARRTANLAKAMGWMQII